MSNVAVGTSPIDELYRRKGEMVRQLKEIEIEIRQKIEDEYKGKLSTAMEILNDMYDTIPNSKYSYIDTYCDECGERAKINLDDVLDKLEYAFNQLIKGGNPNE